MFFRKFIVLVFVIACGASCAIAQDSFADKFEITPFGGYKFGGKINVYGYDENPVYGQDVQNLYVKSNLDYGVIADYSIWSSFAAEFMWVRQPTIYAEQNYYTTPPMNSFLARGTLSTYTFGGAYTFRGDQKVRPFVAAGLGWTNFGNLDSDPSELYVGFNNKFAYNLGGGVKYFLNKFVGLRFDLRWTASRTTPGVSEQCYITCEEVSSSYHMNQGEANLGIILKF
ncbi:MAG: outer membrane beta-barrel protein [Candidatus Acidiferrales bacterium]